MAFKFLLIGVLVSFVQSSVIPTTQVKTEYDPNPQYAYAYDVQDPFTGDYKSQYETRSGDVVRGSYSLIDPDGTKRTVDYTADPLHGFNAVVKKEPIVQAPVVAGVAPVHVASSNTPVVAAAAPPQVISAPAQVVQTPTQVIAAPAQVIAAPAQVIAAPAQVIAAPAQVIAAPAQVVTATAAPATVSAGLVTSQAVTPVEARVPNANQIISYPSHTVAIASPFKSGNLVYRHQYVPFPYQAYSDYRYPNYITSYVKNDGSAAPLVAKVAAPIDYAFPQYYTQYNGYPYDLQAAYSTPVLAKYTLPYTQW